MTDRIQAMRQFQWEHKHHTARTFLPEDLHLRYRDNAFPDYARTALRLEQALETEEPYFFPQELIAFTRTVPNLPRIYDEEEWSAITKEHYIHELGNVSNLSPDYGTVIAEGLASLRDKLTDSDYHRAMRRSIDAVLHLTSRYE